MSRFFKTENDRDNLLDNDPAGIRAGIQKDGAVSCFTDKRERKRDDVADWMGDI